MKKSLLINLTICILCFINFLNADSTKFTVEKSFPAAVFQNLILKGKIDLYFTQSDEVSLIAKAEKESDFDKVLYEYSGNTLTIQNGNQNPRGANVYIFGFRIDSAETSRKIILYLNAPSIENLDKNYGGRIFFESGVDLPKLNVKQTGGGLIELNEITIGELILNRSGGGVLNLSGIADYANIHMSGGGNINAENFNIKKANVTTLGGGRITMLVSEELDLNRSGGGTANISGTADYAKITHSGGGTINADNFFVKEANINTSSGGRVNASVLEKLDLYTSGGATVILSGKAYNAKIEQRSGGRLNASDLIIENADIILSGGVRGAIYVTEMLTIQMTGGGRVEYQGNPRIRQNLSGDARLISNDL